MRESTKHGANCSVHHRIGDRVYSITEICFRIGSSLLRIMVHVSIQWLWKTT